jgi:hypothetical protein
MTHYLCPCRVCFSTPHLFRATGSLLPVLLCLLLISADAPPPPTNYHQDFQKSDEASMPEELLVMNGKFAVVKDGDDKFLQLPGEPLDTFGFMLGADENNSIEASIRATATGKRFPEFGLGLCGAAGYRLWLQPATNELQILKGDNVKISKPYDWKSASWLTLRLQLKKENNKTTLQAKIWPRNTPEPKDWTLTFDDTDTTKPPKGRPSVWGIPYSGTPIDFDDLSISLQK